MNRNQETSFILFFFFSFIGHFNRCTVPAIMLCKKMTDISCYSMYNLFSSQSCQSTERYHCWPDLISVMDHSENSSHPDIVVCHSALRVSGTAAFLGFLKSSVWLLGWKTGHQLENIQLQASPIVKNDSAWNRAQIANEKKLL